MTTALDPSHRRRLRELDERRSRAWDAYQDSLQALEGSEYEAAEHRCWERLQRKLTEVERERAALG
jgi:hypothetical protein